MNYEVWPPKKKKVESEQDGRMEQGEPRPWCKISLEVSHWAEITRLWHPHPPYCVQSLVRGCPRVCVLCRFSRVRLFTTPWTVARQAPLSMGFPRQEYWSGFTCPPPGNLPDPRIEPAAPAVQAESLPLSHQGISRQLLYHESHLGSPGREWL